jgi:hypothetical protein
MRNFLPTTIVKGFGLNSGGLHSALDFAFERRDRRLWTSPWACCNRTREYVVAGTPRHDAHPVRSKSFPGSKVTDSTLAGHRFQADSRFEYDKVLLNKLEEPREVHEHAGHGLRH